MNDLTYLCTFDLFPFPFFLPFVLRQKVFLYTFLECTFASCLQKKAAVLNYLTLTYRSGQYKKFCKMGDAFCGERMVVKYALSFGRGEDSLWLRWLSLGEDA